LYLYRKRLLNSSRRLSLNVEFSKQKVRLIHNYKPKIIINAIS
jgi:hypothetical protein